MDEQEREKEERRKERAVAQAAKKKKSSKKRKEDGENSQVKLLVIFLMDCKFLQKKTCRVKHSKLKELNNYDY